MALDRVPEFIDVWGGCSKAELLTELAKVDAAIIARKAGQPRLTSASLNGSSQSFASSLSQQLDGLSDLRAEKRSLVDALAWVDDSVAINPGYQTASFT